MNPASSGELIKDIEKSAIRFRIAQVVFMLVVVGGLALVIYLQQAQIMAQRETLESVEAQQEQLTKSVGEIKKSNAEALARVERRLNCITVFFSQTDRDSLSITDVEKCSLSREEDIQQFFGGGGEVPNADPGAPSGSQPASTAEPSPDQTPDQPPTQPKGVPTRLLEFVCGQSKLLCR